MGASGILPKECMIGRCALLSPPTLASSLPPFRVVGCDGAESVRALKVCECVRVCECLCACMWLDEKRGRRCVAGGQSEGDEGRTIRFKFRGSSLAIQKGDRLEPQNRAVMGL